jgi:hypothetical protein
LASSARVEGAQALSASGLPEDLNLPQALSNAVDMLLGRAKILTCPPRDQDGRKSRHFLPFSDCSSSLPRSQLKREWSLWLEFGLILGNLLSFQLGNL